MQLNMMMMSLELLRVNINANMMIITLELVKVNMNADVRVLGNKAYDCQLMGNNLVEIDPRYIILNLFIIALMYHMMIHHIRV